ncbi:Bacteriophytochrome [compost metagenome]
MEQVFANLIGNAVQHGAEGTPVTVSLSVEKDMAVIAINNQGKPIEKEAIASIFNPMVRNLRSGEAQYGSTAGLGLGLHIASAIVSAHQGTIEVHSKARVGTTFTVRIPLHPD